ncbi:hypothetical protein IFM89_010457, partial [Coptis chinensis]
QVAIGGIFFVEFGANMESEGRMSTSTPFPCLQIAKHLTLGKAKDENFVFSPCSIQLALSLIANGSKGSTLEELLNFLEAENLNHVNSVATKLIDSFTQDDDEGTSLSFACGVWVKQSFTLKPTFKTIAEDIYRGKAEAMDFENEAKEVICEVHKWVEKMTNGLIKSILPNFLNPRTIVLLANALYFKGNWSNPFDELNTADSMFYLRDGNSVEVPCMISGGNYFINTFDDFKVLKLPYDMGYKNMDNHISMYIILPNKRDGLWALAEIVGSDPLFIEKYLSRHTERVGVKKLMLPKFKITYKFEASKILQEIGLKFSFSEEAEFDEIVLKLYPSDMVEVSNVHHMSVIDVDEEGTEATSVTAADMFYNLCLDEPPVPTAEFVADHPFMFVVRNDNNGTILFMGHVVNPIVEEQQGTVSHLKMNDFPSIVCSI